ncbi:MAG: hypothetical protein M1812_000584 [Candelaria pacifica]|nr:MAG: hypothetical protein M1812_000584 [Candelaria pacifica]
MPSQEIDQDPKLLESKHERRAANRHVDSAAAQAASPQNVFLFLLAFRILNALSIRTFFQPDEYFQSLEPAWEMVFGGESGAWITWEWKHQLRSSIHPAMFAGVYTVTSYLANLAHLSTHTRAELLIAGPKILQAVIAAYGDYYTWRLAKQVYGHESVIAWTAWFCSTRTLSNCLETTWTIVALSLWPWERLLVGVKNLQFLVYSTSRIREASRLRIEGYEAHQQGITKEHMSLTLAAMACVLRPTNLLLWLSLAGFGLLRANVRTTAILIREALLCGSLVLVFSALVDRLYYQAWTFPPLRFLYFNLAQSLAILYGKNDWHYYLSQGFPLLLTTALPFAIVGFWQALRPQSHAELRGANFLIKSIRVQLAITTTVVSAVLSLVSHKEVRFIYPLLPILHILAAKPVAQFFIATPASPAQHQTSPQLRRKPLFITFLAINLIIAWYTASVHQSGVISVMDHLRHTYEQQTPPHRNMTVGFLMPCHSTPWRSHLVYSNIHAWALGCEPPVNLNSSERVSYVDEADRFYADPLSFMRTEMAAPPQQRRSSTGSAQFINREPDDTVKKQWPVYLVFFEQLEETMTLLLQRSGYKEYWRVFNSHWHDDWRRKGDVIVWRLDLRRKRSGKERHVGG